MSDPTPTNIVNLELVFLPKLQSPTKQIIRTATKTLTAAGENYGSIMLSLDVTLKDTKTGEEETIHAAVKAVPKNELIRKLFQPEITFLKEIALYNTIIPTLQQFQRKHGIEDVIDVTPTYYGGRIGLKPDEFDLNAVLILENLKTNGFINIDRTVGFDLETAKLILRDLAKFHAVPLAIKMEDPDLFKEKIVVNLKQLKAFSGFEMDDFMTFYTELVGRDPGCKPYLEQYKEALQRTTDAYTNPPPPHEPWATIAHCDFWVNNTMVKFENGKPVKNKIVDFQMMSFDSPGRDLALFIFTSVQSTVILNNFDELLDTYFNVFLDTLKSLNADTQQFTREGLEEELGRSVREKAVMHCTFMMKPIFASSKNVKPVEELGMEMFNETEGLSDAHNEKLWLTIREFGRRGWL